jgi:hypothetical protein
VTAGDKGEGGRERGGRRGREEEGDSGGEEKRRRSRNQGSRLEWEQHCSTAAVQPTRRVAFKAIAQVLSFLLPLTGTQGTVGKNA